MKERQSPIPVALYARVFRDGQDVGPSVADQLSALRDYADRNGYAVVREYTDETENPEITSSPQFRMLVAEGGWADAPFREIFIWGSPRLPRKGGAGLRRQVRAHRQRHPCRRYRGVYR